LHRGVLARERSTGKTSGQGREKKRWQPQQAIDGSMVRKMFRPRLGVRRGRLHAAHCTLRRFASWAADALEGALERPSHQAWTAMAIMVDGLKGSCDQRTPFSLRALEPWAASVPGRIRIPRRQHVRPPRHPQDQASRTHRTRSEARNGDPKAAADGERHLRKGN
jgi:hypothetical protein